MEFKTELAWLKFYLSKQLLRVNGVDSKIEEN